MFDFRNKQNNLTMIELVIPITFAGVFAGLIQYLVDYKGLQVFDPPQQPNAFEGRTTDSFKQFIAFLERVWAFIKRHWRLFGYIIIGITGAFLTPVISEWTNSRLPGIDKIKFYVECISKPQLKNLPCVKYSPWYTMVLMGYGIIFGYSAVRIIRSIGSFFLGNIASYQQNRIKDDERRLSAIGKENEALQTRLSALTNQLTQTSSFTTLDTGKAVRERYFDEAQNEIDKRTYYASIDLSDRKLLAQNLRNLLISSHKTKFGYNPSLHLYPLVDRYPDGLLKSIYSDKIFSLETILQLDADVDKARAEQFANFKSFNLVDADIAARTEEIESKLLYNCEHVVPQSWFGKKEPMKGDLHHLFTCEVSCNEVRDDDKYHEFDDYEASGPCGKKQNELFEPKRNKGIVARAVLYFLVRYPQAFKAGRGYTKENIPMLIDWHMKHPITLYEKHRNQEIQKKQGNRNPFIDFPQLVDRLDFNIILAPSSGDELQPTPNVSDGDAGNI